MMDMGPGHYQSVMDMGPGHYQSVMDMGPRGPGAKQRGTWDIFYDDLGYLGHFYDGPGAFL